MPKILRSKKMGFCFGVKEAIKLVDEILAENKNSKIYMLGMLVHNKVVINDLKEKGIEILDEKDIDNLKKEDFLIIRAHGTTKVIREKILLKTKNVYDAACIFVKKSREALEKKEKEGYQTIFIGDKKHPEVIGIVSYAEKVVVLEDLEELEEYVKNKKREKLFILAQTTLNKNKYEKIKNFLKENLKNSEIGDTICGATYKRQNAVEELALKVDLVLVVGGKNSSNTKKLYNISKEINENTYFIEDENDLNLKWLIGKELIGITAGASTPEKSIINIEKRIKEEI